MSVIAEIMKEDNRLIERYIYEMRKIFERLPAVWLYSFSHKG
jgi:hypothetical protein